MTKDEALKLALSTLNEVRSETFRLMRNGQTLYAEKKVWDTITAIKEALEQPEPWEKFCDSNCVWTDHHPDCKLAERRWFDLTDKDWNRSKHSHDFQKGVDWAESILKDKNT